MKMCNFRIMRVQKDVSQETLKWLVETYNDEKAKAIIKQKHTRKWFICGLKANSGLCDMDACIFMQEKKCGCESAIKGLR